MSKNNSAISAQKSHKANRSGTCGGQSRNNQLINYGYSLVDFARKTAAAELDSQSVHTLSSKKK